MGRRPEILQEGPPADVENRGVIQVVSRAFNILRCFEDQNMRLGNREIADRCGLPRSTVSRLTLTLIQIGQLVYLPQEQKYALGPRAIALSASLIAATGRPVPEQQLH
ncbi:helix-turn-helix domain-containing protein [Bradyrhizobium tropiciagri]|nr:helix-turn-helix domain-containing protein [Bradyrhizobium tropiciagri]